MNEDQTQVVGPNAGADATQINPKQPALTPDQVRKWLSRAKNSNKRHRKEIWPKYKQAKKRYNSEMGYAGVQNNINTAKAKHNDINLLKNTCQEFIASIFMRNPEVDLMARNEEDQNEVKNIENLEQITNDDIHDRDAELKAKTRSILVDEFLSSMAAGYIDYEYRDQETGEPALDQMGQPLMDEQGQPMMKRQITSQKICFEKILPENLIRPPFLKYYNYQDSPYLGYVDIVSLESLKLDPTLNQKVVGKIQGKEYKDLIDAEIRDQNSKGEPAANDDILHAKIFVVFIKGEDQNPIKRLVICDDTNTDGEYLGYDDWDKGHGVDGRGYPIHILQLNDACEGFIPPSEAWVSEPLLVHLDYIYEKTIKHLKRSGSRTFVKMGGGTTAGSIGLETADLEKMNKNNDQEYIGINKIPPSVSLESLIYQMVDTPLSQDHQAMFELCKSIYDQLSRQPSFSKPSVLNKKKTATESEDIQQQDSTENQDYIDKFKDFLKGIFYDWAKLKQRNLQGVFNATVEDGKTGKKEQRTDLTQEHLQGEFHGDIDVNSFLPPNKALKRQQIKEIIQDAAMVLNPLLQQVGEQLNGKKLTDMYMENADIRDTSDLFIPIVQRNIDQQVSDFVFHQVPFNPSQLGNDYGKSMERLLQIFGDGMMMGDYEKHSPGIGGPQSPLIQMIQALQQMVQQGQKGGGKPPAPSAPQGAPSDMKRNAGMMAGAQRV